MSKVSKDQVQSLVRHILSAAGSLLITQGIIDASLLSEISGTVLAASGLIWAVWDKKTK